MKYGLPARAHLNVWMLHLNAFIWFFCMMKLYANDIDWQIWCQNRVILVYVIMARDIQFYQID